jgi:hypothetical protein
MTPDDAPTEIETLANEIAEYGSVYDTEAFAVRGKLHVTFDPDVSIRTIQPLFKVFAREPLVLDEALDHYGMDRPEFRFRWEP